MLWRANWGSFVFDWSYAGLICQPSAVANETVSLRPQFQESLGKDQRAFLKSFASGGEKIGASMGLAMGRVVMILLAAELP